MIGGGGVGMMNQKLKQKKDTFLTRAVYVEIGISYGLGSDASIFG
jgi:hypothetical protein